MRKKIRHRTDFRALSPRRWTVLAALVAVLLQTFVVQTHIHRVEGPAAATASFGGVALHDRDRAIALAPSAGKADCIICQAFANSGRTTLPSAAALPEIRAFAPLTPLVLAVAAPKRAPLPWRSRAPPIAH